MVAGCLCVTPLQIRNEHARFSIRRMVSLAHRLRTLLHVWMIHIHRLGGLRPSDIPRVLDIIMEQPSPMDLARTPLLATHWRGRMGLTRDQQLQLYLRHRDSSTV